MSPLTPCISICAIDARSGLCAGCGRTLAEIAQWPALDDDERRRIMARLSRRMAEAGLAGAQPEPGV